MQSGDGPHGAKSTHAFAKVLAQGNNFADGDVFVTDVNYTISKFLVQNQILIDTRARVLSSNGSAP